MSKNEIIDHGDHQHSAQEVLKAMSHQIYQLQERLQISGLHNALTKRALGKLLPNIGDSVTIDVSGDEVLNDQGEPAIVITYFRDEDGELNLRAV